MKSFEQWWIKYYKIAFLAGLVILVFRLIFQGVQGLDAKNAIVFFAILTSPIGALIGQILEWIFKLLKMLVEIIVEFIKLRKQRKK
ncbi:hypothetical protein EH223_08260 [candidate division KSB1 bacterium]|nr:hypothetical protein [candidate division KSB1 bacterium]RQW04184.1 MAG: hypothetical protein EH223_08260 [candidate division KSB1 bacterium]